MPPSVGRREGDHGLHQALRLRHRPAVTRRGRETGAPVMDLDILPIPGRPLRGQPDPDRDPRLPGRARGGARRHLRGPLARPDRGARRHDRAAAALRRPRPPRPLGLLDQPRFTFIGAAVFSTIRSRRARIPQEAIIGISYAVASAASILAMSKATSESEHLKDMLVGNILAVSWDEVLKTAVLYARGRRCSTTSSAASSWRSP